MGLSPIRAVLGTVPLMGTVFVMKYCPRHGAIDLPQQVDLMIAVEP